MSWLLIALLAYLLNAVAMVTDKALLKKDKIDNPFVYVFYIAALGCLMMLFVIPFGLQIPSWLTIGVALLSGATFVWALLLMFAALKKDEASRVNPMVGGLTPIFVFLFAWYVLAEKLNYNQYTGLFFLIIGSLIIALDFQKHGVLSWFKQKIGLNNFGLPQIRKTIWLVSPSAVLFGIANVLTKYVYANTKFLTGFIWTRAGSLVAVLLLLLIPANFQAVKNSFKHNKKDKSGAKQTGGLFLLGQACGGGSAILQQYAIFLGSVTLVQAMQGVQYVFVFIFAMLLTIFLPKILKEDLTKELLIQKIIGILIIILGLYFVAV
ncbi:MAG TPA: DMT family transporter [bacterium]|nr:DMT family transporter [bacterium]